MDDHFDRFIEGDLASSGRGDAETAQERYHLVVQALRSAFGDRLKTAVLFGSQARGEARSGSDHDVYVVIEALPQEPLARQRTVRGILLPILDRLPGSISFVARTPEEMAANLTPLLLDVCVDGVCLHGAAYFEPYRQRALAALRQSGLRRRRLGGTLMWVFDRMPAYDWELSWEGYFERAR
jgi:predicted nucleotidyltransferase